MGVLDLGTAGSLLVSQHLKERNNFYAYQTEELLQLLGPDPFKARVVAPDTRLAPNRPTRIGWQPGRPGSADTKIILTGITAKGRLGITVLTVDCDEPRLLSVWDPKDDGNFGYWRPSCLAPSPAGMTIMPPTKWFLLGNHLGRIESRGRTNFRPTMNGARTRR